MFELIINTMETPFLTSQQFTVILPVGLVVIFVVLVFAFGFKSSVEPPSFKNIGLASEDKKNSKKKKPKDKKPQTNGHATVVIDVQDTKAKTEAAKPSKPAKQVETPKPKKSSETEKLLANKPEVQKSPAKKEKKPAKDNESKNKKKSQTVEKPADFDEGEWEVAPSRKEKKNKKKDEPDVLPPYTPEKVSKRKGTATNKKEPESYPTMIEPKQMETLRIEDIMPQLQHDAAKAVVSVIAESNFEPTVAAVVEPVAVKPVPVTPSEAATPSASNEEVPEEQVAKKKKTKKTKSVSETDIAPTADEAPVVAAPSEVAQEVIASPQVFNELEDAWKEAPQKKSKKKVRKD